MNQIDINLKESQDYNDFLTQIERENLRKKNKFLMDLNENGKQYFTDIELKYLEKQQKRNLIIKQIIQLDSTSFSEKELKTKDLFELKEIYEKLKKNKKSFFIKFFEFIFGIE